MTIEHQCTSEATCECGRRLELKVEPDGHTMVGHQFPPCEAFMTQSPDAFMLLQEWKCMRCGGVMVFEPLPEKDGLQ